MSIMQAGHARGLDEHGLRPSGPVHWSLSVPALYEHAVRREEGLLAKHGPLVCRTGAHTGRAPND
jgi:phosphoenolpyruvate carboxykinase (ATP)